MAAESVESSAPIERNISFVKASLDELKKIVPPTRQETVQATLVTVFILGFVSLCLFVLDAIFNRVMFLVMGA